VQFTEGLKSNLPKGLYDRALKLINLVNLIEQKEVKKYLIIKSIFKNKFIEDGKYTLTNYGVWILNNSGDKTFNLACLGYRNHLEIILRKIQKPMIFLDIGANQGIFSLVAAKNHFFKEVHAFEPNPYLYKILNQNFLRNKINRFKIHPYAVCKKDIYSYLNFKTSHSGTGKITKKGNSLMKIKCKNRVYLNQQFMHLSLPIFLKIDVEGMEFQVIEEFLASKLEKKIKFIFVELSGTEYKKNKTIKLLANSGFKETFRKSKGIDDALFENVTLSL
jgi:FkbM family methyltransferase